MEKRGKAHVRRDSEEREILPRKYMVLLPGHRTFMRFSFNITTAKNIDEQKKYTTTVIISNGYGRKS